MSETITESVRRSSPTGKPSGLHPALHLPTAQGPRAEPPRHPSREQEKRAAGTQTRHRRSGINGRGSCRGHHSPKFLFSCDKMQSSPCIQEQCAPTRCSFHVTSLHYCHHLLPCLCQAPTDYEDHHTLTGEPGTETEAQLYKAEGQ